MRRFLFTIAFISVCADTSTFAQNLSTDQMVRDGNFLYEVKIIDEFIERFNDAPNSNLRRQYSRYKKPVNFTRRALVSALFEPPALVQSEFIQKFISDVSDTANPHFIHFKDTGWYAELQCSFTIDGQKQQIPLILQVVDLGANGSQWMITGIGDSYIFMKDAPAEAGDTSGKGKPAAIPPSDDAIGFMELHNILKPGFKADNYFTQDLLNTDKAKKFIHLVQSKKLKFDYPGEMKFHFFQVPGYVFIVDRFVRSTNHSGWLISNLSTATDGEKVLRKQKLLQRSY